MNQTDRVKYLFKLLGVAKKLNYHYINHAVVFQNICDELGVKAADISSKKGGGGKYQYVDPAPGSPIIKPISMKDLESVSYDVKIASDSNKQWVEDQMLKELEKSGHVKKVGITGLSTPLNYIENDGTTVGSVEKGTESYWTGGGSVSTDTTGPSQDKLDF